ncbi:NAD(P)-binding protein, partial [Haloferax sp. KTX1]
MSKKSRKVVAGEYDVVIVGGGVGGITVGVFTSRYGLSTLILDRGRSSLGRIAHLENFPGFPGGIDTPTFQKLLHAQAERVGCE